MSTNDMTRPSEALKHRLSENREVRWAFIEERLRIRFAAQIERLRESMSLTQCELAKLSATTQPMLSRLLSGSDSRSPTIETLVKISDALGKEFDFQMIDRSSCDSFNWRLDEPECPPLSDWAAESTVVSGTLPVTAVLTSWPCLLVKDQPVSTAVTSSETAP